MVKTKKGKRIFITGVAGFIGSNLARALLIRGYNVTGLDNLSQGFKRNISTLLPDKNFRFVKGDVRSHRTVDRLMKGMDCVIHLAAYKIPRYGNAMDTLMTNSRGVRTILESARRKSVKVVFASTSDVDLCYRGVKKGL
jgi:UDP-glucose 4-epimerase